MPARPSRALPPLLVVALLLGLAVRRPATAQAPSPAESVAAAADALEASGYVARFTWVAEGGTRGEVRYRSQTAYGLLVEDDAGAALEYVFLDPDLYTRHRPSGDASWRDWERRPWHPDLPLEGLVQYHPRLPLELLRRARDLRAAEGAGREGEIEGRVSYVEAIAGAYEDEVPGAIRSALGTTLLPLTVRLDAAGAVAAIVLRVTPPPDSPTPPSVLTYELLPDAPSLAAPEGAGEGEPSPFLRPGPFQPPRSLPLTLRGFGSEVRPPPFLSESGLFSVRVDPPLGDVQYRLWRVKRGAQLLAAVGTSVGAAGLALPVLALPPGEYVLEISLPQAVEWTITVEAGEPPPE